MKLKKRVLSVFLVLAMSSVLAGCQGGKNQVALVDRPEQETVISMFSASGAFSSSNQAKYWSENFSRLTGINAAINYEEGWYYADNNADGRTLLRTRIESGNGDDMYIVNAEDMIDFAGKGYILDMTDFDFVDNLSEAARQLSTIDGRVYCLPLSYTGFGLYWNVDMLKEYGLEVPENYGELIEVWDTFRENGITPYIGNKGYALTVPAMCVSLAEVYQSKDKDRLIADLASGTTPASTYVRKGFEFIQLMCDKGYLDPQVCLDNVPRTEGEYGPFSDGSAVCVCSTPTSVFYGGETAGFDVQMTGWPLLEDGVISVAGTDQKLCANPKSGHLDIVTAFIEMAGTKEALMQCTEDGQISAGKVNDPNKYRKSERQFDELIQMDGQIPNTDMNMKINLWEDIRDISRLILSGEATVDDACRLLDERQMQEIGDLQEK